MGKYKHLTPLVWVLAIMLGLYTLAWAADSKISALTELAVANIADGDYFAVVETGAGTKKYDWASMKGDMQTYMDLLYAPISIAGDIASVLDDTSGAVPVLLQAATLFADGDATPSVAGHSVFITNPNTGATTITDFDGGTDGQIIWVIVNDALTTFDFTASGLEGSSADYLAVNGEVLQFVYSAVDNQWHYLGFPKTLSAVTVGGGTANTIAHWDVSGNLVSGVTEIKIPSSDADPTAVAGWLKHDSSSTEADTAARGVIKYHDGTNVRTVVDTGTSYFVVTKTEFLPIAWAVSGTTAPAATAVVTGKEINARAFTELDDVVFWWIVPNDYVGGIKYRVFYALSANASADDTAVFSMTGSIVANSGDLDGGAGTACTVTDELTTDDDQYQVMISDYSAESNADWSLVASGLARLNFNHAAASDMVGAGEPLVIGIEIKYKAKIIGFAGY